MLVYIYIYPVLSLNLNSNRVQVLLFTHSKTPNYFRDNGDRIITAESYNYQHHIIHLPIYNCYLPRLQYNFSTAHCD